MKDLAGPLNTLLFCCFTSNFLMHTHKSILTTWHGGRGDCAGEPEMAKDRNAELMTCKKAGTAVKIPVSELYGGFTGEAHHVFGQ